MVPVLVRYALTEYVACIVESVVSISSISKKVNEKDQSAMQFKKLRDIILHENKNTWAQALQRRVAFFVLFVISWE